MDYSLGIDFGTSGARAIAIDSESSIVAQSSVTDIAQTAPAWRSALFELFEQLPLSVRAHITDIAIDGTSSTGLLCDAQGTPLALPILYNDARAKSQLEELATIAPAQHTVLSATSSLAKLFWSRHTPEFAQANYWLHQADWLAAQLHGQFGYSDYHNCLKLGYDVENLRYPDWLENHSLRSYLPTVLAPGTPIGTLLPELAQTWNFPSTCQIHAGTTDSIAAFLASGAHQSGQAVTSLGSTLVIKLISPVRLENSALGIYSHRLGEHWLVGGASNTGGAVLRHFFSDADLVKLSATIDAHLPSGLDYYPLLQPGERFPINDPNLPPKLTPRPADPQAFLHGLLEGIARIEAQAYRQLAIMGAPKVTHVYTAGGGAQNPTWTALRERCLGVPVTRSAQPEAAFGSACLANGQLANNGLL